MQLVSSSSAIVENDGNVVENTIQETSSNNTISNQVASTSALVSNEEEDIVQNSADVNSKENDTAQTSSSTTSSYFSELKMNRDEMYSKSLETYQKIIDSESISSEQKSIAMQEIEKINNIQNEIKMAEEMIKLKDFEDVVIYSSNGKVSVIVRVAVLADSQVAQIQNIVSKELGVEISDITISNK